MNFSLYNILFADHTFLLDTTVIIMYVKQQRVINNVNELDKPSKRKMFTSSNASTSSVFTDSFRCSIAENCRRKSLYGKHSTHSLGPNETLVITQTVLKIFSFIIFLLLLSSYSCLHSDSFFCFVRFKFCIPNNMINITSFRYYNNMFSYDDERNLSIW